MKTAELYKLYQKETKGLTGEDYEEARINLFRTVLEVKPRLSLHEKMQIALGIKEYSHRTERWYRYIKDYKVQICKEILPVWRYTNLEPDFDNEAEALMGIASLDEYDLLKEMRIKEYLYSVNRVDMEDLDELIRCQLRKFEEAYELLAMAGRWMSKMEIEEFENDYA